MLLTVQTAWAQSAEKKQCVVIHETGQTTAFALETHPVVSFTDTDVKLKSNDITVLYSLDRYLKMTIEETTPSTDIKTVADQSFEIIGSSIIATGCQSLSLYAVDGRCLAYGQPAADGVITLNISQLRAGTYIAVSGNQSFKFQKAK